MTNLKPLILCLICLICLLIAAGPAPVPKVQWEYACIGCFQIAVEYPQRYTWERIVNGKNTAILENKTEEDALDFMGSQGYELVQIRFVEQVKGQKVATYYFKKQK